jgi:predicted flap endonuclease-1-like 5' DNA nuclease
LRRGIAWFAGLAGLLTAVFLRRRRAQPLAAADPAEELRRSLAAAREREEPAPEPEPEAPADPAARRREVHDQARAAIDEMRGETSE